MSHNESINDYFRNQVADALVDENGFPPTSAALDVIMTVVRQTIRTDENHGTQMGKRSRDEMGPPTPSLSRYARDAELALRILRKNR